MHLLPQKPTQIDFGKTSKGEQTSLTCVCRRPFVLWITTSTAYSFHDLVISFPLLSLQARSPGSNRTSYSRPYSTSMDLKCRGGRWSHAGHRRCILRREATRAFSLRGIELISTGRPFATATFRKCFTNCFPSGVSVALISSICSVLLGG